MERRADKATPKRALRYLPAVGLALAVPSSAQTAKPGANDPGRRIVLVSIQDWKLAVIENGNVLSRFPTAVGAPTSPSPTGEFQIVSRVSNPTYYHP